MYRPTQAEIELLLEMKGVTMDDIRQLAWVFSMLMSEGANAITPASLQACYRDRFRMDFPDEDCVRMVSLLTGAGGDAGSTDHIDFTHFAKKTLAVRNGEEAGVAAGAFGTFFDMTAGPSAAIQLRDMNSLLGSLGEEAVADEAQDMVTFAHSLSLQAGSMGFTGSRSALPPQAPPSADP